MTQPNYDSPNTQAQSVMRYNQLFTIQINITIPGDFSIKAGDLVECAFQEVSGEESKEINPYLQRFPIVVLWSGNCKRYRS